jgi:tetratricopeptide (TPR) repeat protein
MGAPSVSVIECPGCGFPQSSPSARNCEQCGNLLLVNSLADLDSFDEKGIRAYIRNYKELLHNHPDDAELNCAMGICNLDLGLFERAKEYFLTAIELMPENAEPYYYSVLSLLKGRRPQVVTLTEIREAEKYLGAAVKIDDSRAKYHYLWALIKYDFYVKNGLRATSPTVDEALQNAYVCEHDDKEVENMLTRVGVDDADILAAVKSSARYST